MANQDIEALWRDIVAELLALSERPSSSIPTLTHQERAYLQLVKPVMIVEGYAILAAPHAAAKTVIEESLAPHITDLLFKKLGKPFSLAVSTQPAVPQPTQSTPQPVAPMAHTPAGDEWFSTRSTPHQDVVTAPGEQIPMGLDELARLHSQQQAERTRTPDRAERAQRIRREKPAHDPDRETSLNPKYTFENFVIGSSNRFANGAAVAVAENPARAYNPLFIWGGSGLGKTHLLHAAGNYAQVLQPGLRIKYVSSEEFTNDYINSVRDDRQESFKRRYRNLDILMVDDIQFLEGKEGTQEEFFHTFNSLHQQDKQIILSSDRPPKQLTTLEDRLRTRFEGGLITDVQPPDLETRIAILMKKASADGTQADRSVLELIASQFESSIRELEGALIRVSAYSSLINEPVTLEVAQVALRDILPDEGDVNIDASAIKEAAAEYFNVTVEQLTGAGKTRQVAHARQLAMYLCRELTELSLPRIGNEFGGKDHTTVMYADRKIRKEMTENRGTYDEIQQLTQMIKNRARMS
ncbi:Chromosomal replication initiator protein DnaA [Corynebacterium capitovis DSM 44611]|uniref:chromosomal replication initiator protein DnaA n=1 Tax=Corynebacterium capitovis TaxID=131081 RepID=UPI0004764568|nr:chromosomal replication initiator protein DnaA [Corynebacterium capitovis]WKD56591.1 Chromosomal replication initiator protein DnaA [Corynebacterium capitovis DSM 44611]